MKTKRLIAIIALMFLLCVSLAAFSACGLINGGASSSSGAGSSYSSGSGSPDGSSNGGSSDSSGSGSSDSGSSSGGATEDCSSGHTYSDWLIDTNATCTETGKKHKTCLRCGHIQTEIIGALGHNYENGECTRCGDIELQPTADEYFRFEKNDEGYTIYANSEKKLPSEIVIPSVYNGKPVTSIGDSAFGGCSGLMSIVIPDSVTSIDFYAFGGCSGLKSITIPDSVTFIAGWAFGACRELEKIEVDNGNLFYHSDGNCLIKTETKTLIAGCKNSIIPSDGSVTFIGEMAFGGCSGLTSITIPNSVTSIGNSAFDGCSGLTSIIIPNSITSIGSSAFGACRELEKIEVDNGNLFYHSDGNCLIETETKTLIAVCKNSIIPSDGSVASIGEEVFRFCGELMNIVIPDSVTSIGRGAFSYCHGLTSIVIPNSVRSIGGSAFYDCSGLTSVFYKGSKAEWSEISIGSNNGKLTTATIYYYSETKPSAAGNYWHYDSNGDVVEW